MAKNDFNIVTVPTSRGTVFHLKNGNEVQGLLQSVIFEPDAEKPQWSNERRVTQQEANTVFERFETTGQIVEPAVVYNIG